MKRLLLTCAALGSLTACAPATRPAPQQFSAVTELQGERVAVVVTNLGPADVWSNPNTCPAEFPVGIREYLPPRTTGLANTQPPPPDLCTLLLRPPELWKVGGKRQGILANIRPAAGTYTVNAWAEPKFAVDVKGKPSASFQMVRVQAHEVVLTVPARLLLPFQPVLPPSILRGADCGALLDCPPLKK